MRRWITQDDALEIIKGEVKDWVLPSVAVNLALLGRTVDEAKAWLDRNVKPAIVHDWSQYEIHGSPEDTYSRDRARCCGDEMESGWDFCPYCGEDLDEGFFEVASWGYINQQSRSEAYSYRERVFAEFEKTLKVAA